MPNTSNHCRVTIDTRVQSAADPRVLLDDIVAADTDGLRVSTTDGAERRFRVADDTFIRIEHPGVRQKSADHVPSAAPGKRIVVAFVGDHYETMRRAPEDLQLGRAHV